MSLIHPNFSDTLMMCWYTNDLWYTKAYSTPFNIKKEKQIQNRWTKGWHISNYK
jgi:hypothetical protein